MATLVAYAIWSSLLQRYPAAAVAPFALLAPCTGVLASALIFGEVFSPVRYAGMALILGGLAVIVLPGAGRGRRPPGAGRTAASREARGPEENGARWP
jgi:O-acetylserine/cysteine efflux transporter